MQYLGEMLFVKLALNDVEDPVKFMTRSFRKKSPPTKKNVAYVSTKTLFCFPVQGSSLFSNWASDARTNTHIYDLDNLYWREGPRTPMKENNSYRTYAVIPYGDTFLLMTSGAEELIFKWDLVAMDWVVMAEDYIQNQRSYLSAVAIPKDFELECF